MTDRQDLHADMSQDEALRLVTRANAPLVRSNEDCVLFMRNALETMERVCGGGGPNIGTIGLSPETVRGVLGSIDKAQKTLGALAAWILQDHREVYRDWAHTVPLIIDDDGEPRVVGEPRRSPPPVRALEQLPPELDEAGKNQIRENARRRGDLQAFGHMSDEWVANRVRMLLRDDLWHEPICQAARDRIMRLSLQLADAQHHSVPCEPDEVRSAVQKLREMGVEGPIRADLGRGALEVIAESGAPETSVHPKDGPGSILGCACIMCEFHRSAEKIERESRAQQAKGDHDA